MTLSDALVWGGWALAGVLWAVAVVLAIVVAILVWLAER